MRPTASPIRVRLPLVLLAGLAALIVGVVVPRWTVADGVDRFEGPERALAEEALALSRLATDHPVLARAVLARRVVSVEPERPGDCTDPAFAEGGAYPGHKAEVVGYTLLRIPMVRVHVTCGGATYTVD